MLATDVEIGASLWAKFMGLMGRESLATGAGLWLPDSNGIHMMFMRFPIDAVFLGREAKGASARNRDGSEGGHAGPRAGDGASDGGGTGGGGGSGARPGRLVVAVYRGLRAWTGLVPFVRGAHGVLELPVGVIDASQTQVGDLIEIG